MSGTQSQQKIIADLLHVKKTKQTNNVKTRLHWAQMLQDNLTVTILPHIAQT